MAKRGENGKNYNRTKITKKVTWANRDKWQKIQNRALK